MKCNMVDKLGRTIDYLRISLTERCNLRCMYCMPEWGCEEVKNDEIRASEVVALVDIFRKLGIKKIRFTGGEPLLREDLGEIIKEIKKFPEIEEICLTTNGILLENKIEELKNAGLNRVNVSLDSVDVDEYRKITRGGDLNRVLRGIELCKKLNVKVKLNGVMTNLTGERAVYSLGEYALENKIDLRFIELMPIGCGKDLKGYSGENILEILRKKYTLRDLDHLEGTSRYFSVDGYHSRIGFINPMSQCFCKSCNRVRITADCNMKRCLSADDKISLREILQSKSEDSLLYIKEYLLGKNEENSFFKDNVIREKMNEIGG